MSAPTPPPLSKMTTIAAIAGGIVTPPPVRSVPSPWMPLVDVVDVANLG